MFSFTTRFSVLAALVIAVSAAPKVIHPSFSNTKCLTAANANNAAVEIRDCVSGAANQAWNISGSSVTIFGNKCLDDPNGSTANGQKLQVYTCFSGNTNQQWSVSGQTFKLVGTNKCMDLTDGNQNNGNVVQLYDCTSGVNQRWNVADVVNSPTNPPVPATGVIKPIKQSGSCLTVQNNVNNAPVVVRPCDGSASQKFSFSNGKITIFGNKCLDVPNGSTATGTKMEVYTCFAGNTNQQFTFTDSPANLPISKQIHWANSGANLCLDLTEGSLIDGTQSQVWTCGSTNGNQYWNIV